MTNRLHDLLESAAPEPADTDYRAVATRGRRRRHRGQLALGVAGVSVVGASVAAAVVFAPTSTPGADVLGSLDETPASAAPPLTVAAVGTWEQAADWPLEPVGDPYAAATSDGRVVVFGGQTGMFDDAESSSTLTGAVLDPSSGEWSTLPPAPLSPRLFPTSRLAGDRLVVFGANDATQGGALLDLTEPASEPAWVELPADGTSLGLRVVGWDGERLIVTSDRDGDFRADELRSWTVGADAWAEVPMPPLAPERLEGSLRDGVLAVWVSAGGSYGYDPATGAFTDGNASYVGGSPEPGVAWLELTATEPAWQQPAGWTAPAAGALAVGWLGAALAVVPTLTAAADGVLVDIAAGTVTPLPAGPLDALHSLVRSDVPGSADAALVQRGPGADGPAVSVLLADGTWSAAIAGGDAVGTPDALIAIAPADGVDPTFSAWIHRDGAWVPTAEAPFPGRRFASNVQVGDRLVVVGGATFRSPAAGEAPDATPSEADEPGPYVIDQNVDAWILDLTGD